MLTPQKYLNLLSCVNESALDIEISELSEYNAKQTLKILIQFLHDQKIDPNAFIQYSQKQLLS